MIAFEYLFFVFQIMLEIVLSFDAGEKVELFCWFVTRNSREIRNFSCDKTFHFLPFVCASVCFWCDCRRDDDRDDRVKLFFERALTLGS
jgi:hypothetical protein